MGARLPVVQGTSFAFLPVMIPLAGKGVDAIAVLMGGIIVGGVSTPVSHRLLAG